MLRVIAEVGENHMGHIRLAHRMIEEAKIAGADIVKFQSYFGNDFKDDDPEKQWFRQVELSNDVHFALSKHAHDCGIELLSSPFSKERARFLVEDLGLRRMKVASGVMMNFPILDYLDIADLDELIVSTGMATVEEIRIALSHLRNVRKITLLHCTSLYPCPDAEANLLAIPALQASFPMAEVGYSDHTVGEDACIAAVGIGASVIEKHFTLNKKWAQGTDHVLSLEPVGFRAMVDAIRRVEVMRGVQSKMPTSGEREIKDFVRSRFLQ